MRRKAVDIVAFGVYDLSGKVEVKEVCRKRWCFHYMRTRIICSKWILGKSMYDYTIRFMGIGK